MRVALAGAYGAGKSTLADAVSAATGWPIAQVGPMADPVRGTPKALDQCSLEEVFRLSLRRLDERARSEAALGTSLISDGSVLHEWVYLRVLAAGLHRPPAPGTQQTPGAEVLARLAEQALAEHAQSLPERYDLLVYLAPEHALPPTAPIGAPFQHALDTETRRVLADSGARVVTARGTVRARTRAVLDAARRDSRAETNRTP
ncbi:AAA family ATPase [Promicromonospora soli]|uniref:ATP/GTP-binding protein n=1 Tax=Promicromonospora soli TaxID=2035533 RepID=A0A919FJM4_9MICO|nr:AAA family ATPase [Promicromonospora soli]GHH67151.1 ATP/GTP-binding protein [Promicromonospora soli]